MNSWLVVQLFPGGKPYYEVWSGPDAENLARTSMADALSEDAHRGDGELVCKLIELHEYDDNYHCGGE